MPNCECRMPNGDQSLVTSAATSEVLCRLCANTDPQRDWMMAVRKDSPKAHPVFWPGQLNMIGPVRLLLQRKVQFSQAQVEGG